MSNTANVAYHAGQVDAFDQALQDVQEYENTALRPLTDTLRARYRAAVEAHHAARSQAIHALSPAVNADGEAGHE